MLKNNGDNTENDLYYSNTSACVMNTTTVS